MASLNATCDTHTSESAVEWCSECEQALCFDCVEYHSRVNLSKSHTTVSLSDFLKLPSFVRSLKRYCDNHGDKLDYFCRAHNDICCFHCYQSAHKQCVGVERLQKVADNIKYSNSMGELEQDIEDLKTNITRILQDRSQNISNLDKRASSLLIKIQEAKQELIKHFDKLEKRIISELTNIVKKEKSRIDTIRNKIEKKNVKVRRISQDLDKVKQIAPVIQTFLSMLYLRKEVSNEITSIQDLEKDGQFMHAVISYEKPRNTDDVYESIKSIGNIVLQLKRVDTFKLKERKGGDVPIDQNVTNDPENICDVSTDMSDLDKDVICPAVTSTSHVFNLNAHFKSEMYIKTKGGTITFCKILRNNNIIFADNISRGLLFYSCNEKFFKMIDLTSQPYDLACTSECQVAVTLCGENVVCLINVYKGCELKRIKTTGPCYGVAFTGDKLYVNIRLPHQTVIQTIHLSDDDGHMENTFMTLVEWF